MVKLHCGFYGRIAEAVEFIAMVVDIARHSADRVQYSYKSDDRILISFHGASE